MNFINVTNVNRYRNKKKVTDLNLKIVRFQSVVKVDASMMKEIVNKRNTEVILNAIVNIDYA